MIPGFESWQKLQTACRLQWSILKDSVRHQVHDKNANILIEENAIENVVCKMRMTAILSRPHVSEYILHFQWIRLNVTIKVSLMITRVVCKSAQTARCPVALRQQAIMWTKFCHIQQVILLWPKWDLCPSSKRTGDTAVLHQANFEMQEIWHDFCFRSFYGSFDTRDLTRL